MLVMGYFIEVLRNQIQNFWGVHKLNICSLALRLDLGVLGVAWPGAY